MRTPLIARLPLLLALTCSAGCLTSIDLSEDLSPKLQPSPDSKPMPQDANPDPDLPRADLDSSPDLADEGDLADTDDDLPDESDDLADLPPLTPGQGLLISEVVEGSVGSRKAVEIFNSLNRDVSLQDIYLVLVNHNAEDLYESKLTFHLGEEIFALKAGAVLTLCHPDLTRITQFEVSCDLIRTRELAFNGDDRIALAHIIGFEITGQPFEGATTLLDAFGDPLREAPEDGIWTDASFRRCSPAPYLGETDFVVEDHFFTVKDLSQSGQPPRPAAFEHLGMAPLLGGCSP